MEYATLKWLHILSATLLFGTGLGSAFYKWNADRSGDLAAIAHTNRIVVLADWLFTTPTVILQPLTGFWLIHILGYSLTEPWLVASYVLYIIAGACWLPVVWMQIRMRDLAQQALRSGEPLGEPYHRFRRRWLWLGIPAFTAMLMIYYLMVFKPVIAI